MPIPSGIASCHSSRQFASFVRVGCAAASEWAKRNPLMKDLAPFQIEIHPLPHPDPGDAHRDHQGHADRAVLPGAVVTRHRERDVRVQTRLLRLGGRRGNVGVGLREDPVREVRDHLDLLSSACALDLGCGDGGAAGEHHRRECEPSASRRNHRCVLWYDMLRPSC